MAKTICDVCAKRSFCVVKSEFYPVVKCTNYENTNDTITKVEQTNEEYLKSCTTKQLAETIAQYFYGWTTNSTPYDIILHSVVEWLKQPHTKGVEE